MRMPSAHAAGEVAAYQVKMEVAIPFYNESIAVLKRPKPIYHSLSKRIGLAWEVFTGKSDVLRWIKQ